jgi:ABC-type Fe3+ transport system permease subunit
MVKNIINRYKYLLAAVLASLLVLAMTMPAQALFESSIDEACKGATLDGTSNCPGGQAETQINSTIEQGFMLFSTVIGVIAVVMIIIAGIKYVTSTGDPASVNSAKNTMLYAVIGLVIAALAQVIVRFVLTQT